MVMRIRVEDLGDEVRERLARGEPVEIERDGEVVARMEPCAPEAPRKVDWQAYFEARQE
ncbi:MAG: hypothetical protein U5Q44_06415 [Dehalococcoidia bacterium]|nr:hypothetical protein [Dehalococcoidia bacterium]